MGWVSTTSGAVCAWMLWASPCSAGPDHFDIGDTIPSFALKAINVEGAGAGPLMAGMVRLNDFIGSAAPARKQAVLLTFFATYCVPCKREMPFLAVLYDTFRDRGLQVLSVSIDTEAPEVEVARTLARDSSVKFPVLTDRLNIVARRYGVTRLPCAYLINADGKVTMASVGYDPQSAQRLLDETRRALGIPTTDALPVAIASFMATHHKDPASGVDAPDLDSGVGDGHERLPKDTATADDL